MTLLEIKLLEMTLPEIKLLEMIFLEMEPLQGDAIILYERNRETDNVTNKMVFKGNIEYLTENEIGIRLRATQQNPSVLPAESLYAIEHDTMDTTFRSMYQGL